LRVLVSTRFPGLDLGSFAFQAGLSLVSSPFLPSFSRIRSPFSSCNGTRLRSFRPHLFRLSSPDSMIVSLDLWPPTLDTEFSAPGCLFHGLLNPRRKDLHANLTHQNCASMSSTATSLTARNGNTPSCFLFAHCLNGFRKMRRTAAYSWWPQHRPHHGQR